MDTWQGLHSLIALNKAKCLAGEGIALSIVKWPLDCSAINRTNRSTASKSKVIYLKPLMKLTSFSLFNSWFIRLTLKN